MSDTLHHKKPGTPPTPAKRALADGRATSAVRRALALGDYDALAHSESMSLRRTRR